MYLLEWINVKTRSVVRYFKPNHDSTFQNLEEGELGAVKNGAIDISSTSVPASIEAADLVNEPALEQVSKLQSPLVSAYQITAGLASLVLSKKISPEYLLLQY